jgi:hypothetical protein
VAEDDLEVALLDDVQRQLDRWRVQFSGRRDAERKRLVMLALEREQIVAVAYREEAVAGRVADLDVGDDARAVIRQTLVWIWKDEQLHAEYIRGELLKAKGLASKAIVYGRQLQGALSGWTSASSNHLEPRTAPFRAGAAGLLVALAGATGQVPPVLRIRADEERHTAAFRLLTGTLSEDDRLVDPAALGDLVARLGAISTWFVPAYLRHPQLTDGGVPRTLARRFGSQGPVVVRHGSDGEGKAAVVEECLDRAGLGQVAAGAASPPHRVSLNLGY